MTPTKRANSAFPDKGWQVERLLSLFFLLLVTVAGGSSCSADPEEPQLASTTTGAGGCLPGQTPCAGGCVDLLTNAGHCGVCGNPCGAGFSCVGGECTCQAGLNLCGASCVDLLTDSSYCGGCGQHCAAGQVCSGGVCTCSSGSLCGTACVDVSVDPLNCGGCAQACQTSQQCMGGTCTCRAGLSTCGAECVAIQNDPDHCGGCAAACDQTLVCSQGACQAECAVGETNCSRSCVDVNTDPSNCGECGNACAAGRDCVEGVCRCAGGLADCSGQCVDLMTNSSHCGACGAACAGGQGCNAGSCGCPNGQTSCSSGAEGLSCRNLQTDAQHCGACGSACTGGQVCSGGTCACQTGFELCDETCVAAGTCNASSSSTGALTSTTTNSTSTGTTGAGGSTSSTSTTGQSDCTFSIEDDISDAIASVGIVEWSVTGVTVNKAEIHFGLSDGSGRELVAPVDLEEDNYRTLLLGMKESRDYTYKIVVNDGACTSEERSLSTGAAPNNLPSINRTVSMESAVTPGFFVTSGGLGGQGSAPAFIFDQDGDVVWWATAPPSCSRARMDWEGKNIWMLALNVQNGQGEMRRVSMDGLDVQNNVPGLNRAHHDFTVVPGGIVTAISWIGSGMDVPSDILERSPDGTIKTAFTLDQSFYQSPSYHANAITYIPEDESYVISDRNPSLYVKVSRQGELEWQFGGSNPVGPFISGGSWEVNHGHHLLSNGNFLIFNNGGFVGGSSAVIEFALNTSSMTGAEVWRYTSSASSPTLGDVQRLSNGNTIITYSNSGVIHEVNGSGQLVQSITVGSLGYVIHRDTLYGPPPK